MFLTKRTPAEYQKGLDRASPIIRVCRVLCIFSMCYVHVFLFSSPTAETTFYFLQTRDILVDLLGRSSVPLLSVISGVLMVGFFSRRSLLSGLRDRARVLLLPMLTWNVVGLGLIALGHHSVSPHLADALFGITGPTLEPPLGFLRDIFVISALTPALLFVCRRIGPLLIPLVGLTCFWFELSPFILRESILVYFSVGIVVGLYRTERIVEAPLLIGATLTSLALLVLMAILRPSLPQLQNVLRHDSFDILVRRPVCALSFWYVGALLGKQKRLLRLLGSYLEPAIFLMFLSHCAVMRVFASAYAHVATGDPFEYFLVWLLMPVFCLMAALGLNRLMPRLPSSLALALSGKANKRLPIALAPG